MEAKYASTSEDDKTLTKHGWNTREILNIEGNGSLGTAPEG